ncbi:MAG TPA: hypothetical protein VGK67_11125 [Myxococcales bacterium]
MRQLIAVAAAVLLASGASAAEPGKAIQPATAKASAEAQPAEAGASAPGKAPEAAPAPDRSAEQAKPAEAAPAPAKKKSKPRIAVLDVRTAGTLDPKTFEGLSGLIASEIAARASAVQVIGSGDIRAMVGFEREKQLMGCSESACLAEIGGALGVDWMLTTEGSKLGGTWILTMVLIDVPKSRPLKRLSQRTDQENKVVDEAILGVRQMVAELPKDESAPAPAAPVAAVETRPAEGGRNKVLTWGLLGGGVVALVVGSVTAGMGWETRRSLLGDQKAQIPTSITREEAKAANSKAIAGYVVGAVGIAAAVWGGLSLVLPESPAQVAVVPGPDGIHASVTVRLP